MTAAPDKPRAAAAPGAHSPPTAPAAARPTPLVRADVWRALALATLAAALLVRLPGLTESLWFDEALRTGVVLGTPAGWRLTFYDVHNPLYNLLMTGWIALFGDSEVSIRLPSLLAGFAAVLVAARWAAARFGGAVAWPFAAWALLAPAHAWYSVEAKNNMFAALMGALVIVSYSRLMGPGGPTRARLLAAACAGVLAALTDFILLLVVVPVWLAHAANLVRLPPPVERGRPAMPPHEPLRRRAAARALGAAALATMPAVLPLAAFKLAHYDGLFRGYLHHFDVKELLLLLCGFFITGNAALASDPWRVVLAAALAPGVLALLALGWRRMDRTSDGRILHAVLALPLLAYLAASYTIASAVGGSRHWIYQDRNLLFLLIPFGLILWAGVAEVRRPVVRRAAAGSLITLALLGGTLMHTLYEGRRTVGHPPADWRGATAMVAADAARAGADAAPSLILTRSYTEPLRYYARAAEVVRLDGDGATLERIRRAAADGRAVYIISNRDWFPITDEDRQRLGAFADLEPLGEAGPLEVLRLRAGGP